MLRFLLLADLVRPAESAALSAALRRHHPGAERTWLVTDPRPVGELPGSDGDGVAVAARRLVGSTRYLDVVMALSPAAARWAVVPGAVAELLRGDDDTVVVLPASTHLDGSLDELVAAAGGASLLLPRRFDAASGTVSGGWLPEVGVFGPAARPFLRWWEHTAEQVARTAEVGPAWRDDPWEVFVSEAPGLHAAGEARWRVHPSTVSAMALALLDRPGGPEVHADGRPVVLAAFPGFDPGRPWWYVAPGEERPRVSVGESTALRHLTHLRAAELRRHGARPGSGPDRGDAGIMATATLAGVNHSPALADAWRRELASVGEGRPPPPNPHLPGQVESYAAWVTGNDPKGATGVSRVADALWADRPDLATVFGDVRGAGRASFTRWLWTSGLEEGLAPAGALPDPPRPRRSIGPLAERRFGVNLVGYHASEAGLGVAVRRVGAALDAAGIPWQAVTYARTASRQRGAPADGADAPFFFNLVLVTAEQLPFLVGDLGRGLLEGRHTIGLWFYETDVMPRHDRASFGLVDEVWAATAYLRDVFAAHTDLPVTLVPVPLEFAATPPRAEARARLGLDERFTCLFSFDFLSVAGRKNPSGVLDAYRRAFPTPGDTRLILKSINGDVFPEEREALADLVGERPDVELWDRYLDAGDRLALVAAADCYVSLHRSEGLGLTMAEAMAAGTPVVASRYSGNLDFMDDDCALLVGGDEVTIGPGSYYPAEGHWFDPDLDEAARHLRRLRDDPDLRRRLAVAGRRRLERFSAGRVGDLVARRLHELWSAQAGC